MQSTVYEFKWHNDDIDGNHGFSNEIGFSFLFADTRELMRIRWHSPLSKQVFFYIYEKLLLIHTYVFLVVLWVFGI